MALSESGARRSPYESRDTCVAGTMSFGEDMPRPRAIRISRLCGS